MEDDDVLFFQNHRGIEVFAVLALFVFGLFGILCGLGYLGQASQGTESLGMGIFFVLVATLVSCISGSRSVLIDGRTKEIISIKKTLLGKEKKVVYSFTDIQAVLFDVINFDDGEKRKTITLQLSNGKIVIPTVKNAVAYEKAKRIAQLIGIHLTSDTDLPTWPM